MTNQPYRQEWRLSLEIADGVCYHQTISPRLFSRVWRFPHPPEDTRLVYEDVPPREYLDRLEQLCR